MKATLTIRKAIITGASSGIGAAFARLLAARGTSLIIVARRAERMQSLAAELQADFGVMAVPFPADLSLDVDIERVVELIQASPDLDLLVNNAGYGLPGYFHETPQEQIHAIIQVHVSSAVRLAHAALQGMRSRQRGAIINVTSMASYVVTPRNVAYSATKAFMTVFSEGLMLELQGTPIRVLELLPGFTHTEFHNNEQYQDLRVEQRIPKWMWMSADKTAAAALRDLERGRRHEHPQLRPRRQHPAEHQPQHPHRPEHRLRHRHPEQYPGHHR